MTNASIRSVQANVINEKRGIIELQGEFKYSFIPVSARVAVIFTDTETNENRRIPMAVTVEGDVVRVSGTYEIPYVFLSHSPEETAVSFSVSDGTDNGVILTSDVVLPHYKRSFVSHFISSSKREKIKILTDIVLNAISLPFRLLPVKKNRVSFFSNRTDELTGNIREVYNEISKDDAFEVKVLSKGGGVRSAFSLLFGFMYLYMTSKVVYVDDYFHLISYVKKKDETKLIQLWHACGAFKTFGFSRIHKDSKLKVSSANHRQYDYAVVSSQDVAHFYAEAFGISTEKAIALGSPRCDRLVDEAYIEKTKEKFYSEYPQLKGKKLFMFAPTFRGGGHGDCYYPKEDFDVDHVLDVLGDEWAVLIKLHPYLTEKFTCKEENKSRMVDCSAWDVNDVLFVTDFLVTDYSSVIFEASILDIPMAFYAKDLEEFIATRDFYYDFLSFIPGTFYDDIDDVAVLARDNGADMEKIRQFKYNAFGNTIGYAGENIRKFTHQLID